MTENKGTLELSSDEAVLLVRALHALMGNVEAAATGKVINSNERANILDAILEMDAKVKSAWELPWKQTGWGIGR